MTNIYYLTQFPVQSLSKGCRQVRAAIIWQPKWGGIDFQQGSLLAMGWSLRSLPHGPLHRRSAWLSSQRDSCLLPSEWSEGIPRKEATVIYNLILKVIHHYFCFSVGHPDKPCYNVGGENTRLRILGGKDLWGPSWKLAISGPEQSCNLDSPGM